MQVPLLTFPLSRRLGYVAIRYPSRRYLKFLGSHRDRERAGAYPSIVVGSNFATAIKPLKLVWLLGSEEEHVKGSWGKMVDFEATVELS